MKHLENISNDASDCGNAVPVPHPITGLFMRAPAFIFLLVTAVPVIGAGNVENGARVFGACVACHSLEPDLHLSGPSLAGIWNRKAGSLEGFERYSDALKNSKLVWNEKSLDIWLRNPQAMIPGNFMPFAGLKDDKARADLIAYLKIASDDKSVRPAKPRYKPNLKEAKLDARVQSIRHCRDTYFITTAAGHTFPFWEFNLRLKTDSSNYGPPPGKPVLVGTGMQGDRAAVVFAAPGEISAFIRRECR